MADFDTWFKLYSDTYKSGKDLFHNQFGAPDGPWKNKFKKDLERPNLYPIFEGKATLEDNCNEALERLRADIRARRILKNKGKHRSMWVLPMLSVYVGQGEKGRRYTWDIPNVSEVAQVELKPDRYFTPPKHKKSSPEVARDNLNRLRGLLK